MRRINAATAKVPGLDGQKMSKSYNNTIPIFARGKRLKKIVGQIVTDSKDFTKEPLDPPHGRSTRMKPFSRANRTTRSTFWK